METKMNLQWKCSECHEEQSVYLSEAEWQIRRDRCNDIEGVIIWPRCSYCGNEDDYEVIE